MDCETVNSGIIARGAESCLATRFTNASRLGNSLLSRLRLISLA
jgi:hypothetical protein